MAENVNQDQGKPEDQKTVTGGAGTGQPLNIAQYQPPPLDDQEIELNINGEIRKVKGADLKAAAQKQYAGEDKLRAASEKERANQDTARAASRHTQMTSDLKLAQGGDVEAIRRLPGYPELGITADHAERVITLMEDEQKKAEGGADQEQEEIDMERLPPKVRKAVEKMEREEAQQQDKALLDLVKKRLESDDEIGYVIKSSDKRSQRLSEYGLSALKVLAARTGRVTPEVLKEAVESTRQYAKDLGVLEPQETPVPGLPFPGLGRSPTSSSAVLRRPSEAPKRLTADKAGNTEDYADNVLQRMLFNSLSDEDEE
jgi:hypothetical protein